MVHVNNGTSSPGLGAVEQTVNFTYMYLEQPVVLGREGRKRGGMRKKIIEPEVAARTYMRSRLNMSRNIFCKSG